MYAAKFNADGTGQWLELNIADAKVSGYTGYAFANQADVLVNARHAADAGCDQDTVLSGTVTLPTVKFSDTHQQQQRQLHTRED